MLMFFNKRDNLGIFYTFINNPRKVSYAIRCVEDGIISNSRGELKSWYEIAGKLFKAKKYKSAAKSFEYSVLFEKNSETFKYALGNAGKCYRILGDYDKALEYLNKRLDFDKNDTWTLNQINLVKEKK